MTPCDRAVAACQIQPVRSSRLCRSIALGLLASLVVLVAWPAFAQQGYVGVSRPADIRELAFAVRGKVAEVLVKPGDRVEAGDLLIRLDDSVQRASHALAKSQAEDETGVQLAELTVRFRKDELEITKSSETRGGANAQDVREAQFAFDRAEVELRSAISEQEQRRLSLEREAARLAEMQISSPIAGDVIETHKEAGETVDELTTVVTVVDIGKLHIDFPVAPSVSRMLKVGDAARVVWQDIEADPVTDARVIFIPATGDPTVREVTIRIEVPNPDRLPSGLHARVTFEHLGDASAQRP